MSLYRTFPKELSLSSLPLSRAERKETEELMTEKKCEFLAQSYPFPLMPLPYEPDALEPYIDAQTVVIHHDKHLKAYVDNLNKVLSGYPQYHGWSLERLIKNISLLPEKIQTPVRNNAGGVFNHNLYFSVMGPYRGTQPSPALREAIEKSFCSMDSFQEQMKQTALDRFGSGYAWLAADKTGCLKILSTANQDTILCMKLTPLLLIDVWEHAYYLKYQNRRGDYAENWFEIINWDAVSACFAAAME